MRKYKFYIVFEAMTENGELTASTTLDYRKKCITEFDVKLIEKVVEKTVEKKGIDVLSDVVIKNIQRLPIGRK